MALGTCWSVQTVNNARASKVAHSSQEYFNFSKVVLWVWKRITNEIKSSIILRKITMMMMAMTTAAMTTTTMMMMMTLMINDDDK